ncbi:MAG: hypothetical protein RLZZ350_360 [Verrucomicrobiota bacterium]|jgi:putative membrane protein
MKPQLKILQQFLQRWLVNTIAVLVVIKVVKISGIVCDSKTDLLIATLLLGFLNAFVRPLMLLLSLPLLIFTLGLFTFVINALLLYFVGNLWSGFQVHTFKAAFWGALVISFVSLVLNTVTGSGNARVQFQRTRPPQPKPPGNDDDGPVIDV